MTAAPITSARDYSLALFGALVGQGLDESQAIDCARNVAGPLASLADVSVYEAVAARLRLQRGFGLDVSDYGIDRCADACVHVPRFVEAAAEKATPRISAIEHDAPGPRSTITRFDVSRDGFAEINTVDDGVRVTLGVDDPRMSVSVTIDREGARGLADALDAALQQDAPEMPQAVVAQHNHATFRSDIGEVLNRCSMERGSNTPDFLLAQYLVDCLAAFDRAVQRRETWHGRSDAFTAAYERADSDTSPTTAEHGFASSTGGES